MLSAVLSGCFGLGGGDSDDEDEGLNLEEFGLNEGDDEDEMSNPSTGPNAL